ncbi:3-ketoacyl-ACP reductase [Brooklawnia cerclae]|uniref:NAD(P)-dependent dehydrogenase (Short-subunit alcohol dehydrogenase family) n=1 Tax=Brooklawnia cerclae TaxID=349934 RepID=A0ABX0SK09_9ACTN|nr:3-ketoacyl-ACP reductase [Brooklawnia cerclae]NIH58744.1 NAD(P)-dependent dehydrogenase (short-subunit alcohol dehydrogenase family) [Brooklawnia cerclae]
MNHLDQPVAMVTGGNRGIGRGITERLLQQGWAVSIMATRPAPDDLLAELGTLGPVRYTRGSVDDLASHERFVAETRDAWGRIDALVNNAGVAPAERLDILEATPDSFDRVLGINLRGPYFLTQRVAREMIRLRDAGEATRAEVVGTIVNVTSISSEAVSTNRGEYCISKAGATMATKLWAARLAPEGILVYEVRPGVVETDMTAGVKQKYDDGFAHGLAPMPRWGRPSDVGGAVFQLVSGQMPYSTGDVVHVDGGMHIARL